MHAYCFITGEARMAGPSEGFAALQAQVREVMDTHHPQVSE